MGTLDNGIGIGAGVVAVLAAGSNPVGWATAAVAYGSIALHSEDEVSNWLGELNSHPQGQQGAEARGFGVVSIIHPDGTPVPGTFWGDAGGMQEPDDADYTHDGSTSVTVTKSMTASVYFNSTQPIPLQTWKVNYSTSVSAWSRDAFGDETAEAWLTFECDRENRVLEVFSNEGNIGNATGHTAGE